MTVTPWSREMSEISAATAAWFGRSRLSSGSPSRKRAGPPPRPLRIVWAAHEPEPLVPPAVTLAPPPHPAESRQRDSPPVAVEAQAHDVDAAHPESRVEAAPLRKVAE